MTASTTTSFPEHKTEEESDGSIIYSSEGIATPFLPPPPSFTANLNDNTKECTLESSINIDPLAAFEVFRGKAFAPVNASSNNNINHLPPYAVNNSNSNETPLARLARLQEEIVQVERDLNMTLEDVNDSTASSTSPDKDSIGEVVQTLAQRLNVLSTNVHQRTRQRQNDLTNLVQNEKTRLSINNTTTATTTTTTTANAVDSTNHSIIEARLARIEAVTGIPGNKCHDHKNSSSVLERLKEAETILSKLDDKALQAAASKAKVIRSDLEEAEKASKRRHKLTSFSDTDQSKLHAEDIKIIESLHQQLLDLDGFLSASSSSSSSTSSASSDILSIILDRLSSCAELHTRAANFDTDLTQLQTMAADTHRLLHNAEQVLHTVEKGMMENMERITENMTLLDQKLAQTKKE